MTQRADLIHAASIQVVPSLRMAVHRGCRSCGTANPTGQSRCPGCGADMPPSEHLDADNTEFGRSVWFAATLIRVGNWLRRIAKRTLQ